MSSSQESPKDLTALEHPAAESYCPTCDQTFGPTHNRCPIDGTGLVRLTTPKDPLIGRELDGRFTLKKRIGAGGMGAVYLAWQHSVGREVAIKVIHPKHNTDREAAKRFLRESKLASRLQHPNTVTVLEFNQTEDGMLYLVMELLHGRQLSEVLQQEGPFSVQRMIRVAIQLCDALEAAHSLSIVHRDLKPGNIIILDGPPGRDFVKVLDFGLARSLNTDESSKLTRTGEVVGTPHYLPPEAALGNPMDLRGDIYSLGVIFYELLAGRLPFEAEGRRAMMIKHVYEDPLPLPLEIPDAVSNLIMKMLEKEPARRQSNVVELRAALTDLLSTSGQTNLPAVGTQRREPSQQIPVHSSVPPTVPRPTIARTSGEVAHDNRTSVLPAAPRSRAWLLALGPLVGVILGALYWTIASKPTVTSTPIKESPPIATPQPKPQPEPVKVTPLAPPTVKVKLSLRSKPNASVKIGDSDRGRTPLELEWDQSDTPIEITFNEPGKKPVTQKIVPDHAQTVDVTLPSATKAGKSGKAGKQAEKEGFLLPSD